MSDVTVEQLREASRALEASVPDEGSILEEKIQAAAEEMDKLRERIRELEGNGLPNIEERPEFTKEDDATSLLALRRWVEAKEPDIIMRSVSEGGDVFEFDPTSVVALMREVEGLRAAIKALRLHGEAYFTLKGMEPLHEWRQRLATLLAETGGLP